MRYFWIVALLILFMANGCGSQKKIVVKYYTIDLAGVQDTLSMAQSPVVAGACEIEPISINPAFASYRIANRLQTHEITYYAHHQWAVKPEDAFTQITLHQLQRWGVFEDISTRFWKLVPDYQLQGYINALEIVDDGNQMKSHLDVEFRLVDYKTKHTIVRHTAEVYTPLGKKNMNLFATAISRAYYIELKQFSDKIRDHFGVQSH